MASRIKQGKYGMTQPRVTSNIIGTVIVCNRPPFNDIKGEIVNKRNDHMRYLTVQVPSEYPNRVYTLNLLEEQCKDIRWIEEWYGDW
jgi:hypothetical protein